MAMQVKEIMHKDVKTIKIDATIQETAEAMKKFGVGALVVVNDSRLAGIITESDIVEKVVAESLVSSKIKVKDVMSKKVIMISPDKDIGEAAEIMAQNHIKKLPVLQGNRLIGIVTVTDLCMAEPKLMEQVGALMMMEKKKSIAG